MSEDDEHHHHHRSHRFLALTGGRVTRDTSIYVVGLLAVGPFSLISVAVLTRVLATSQYGALALLMVFAGYLTTLYNTGSLHGTFMLVYGVSDGEGDEVGEETGLTSTPRRSLATGVLLTLMIVSVGTAVCFVTAPQIAGFLLGDSVPHGAALVRWAAASAAAGSLWRLTVNVLRMERKPVRFSAFNALRPLFVVAGVVPLVLLGFGVQGALAGTMLGSLLATAACIAAARRSYELAFSWSDAKEIVRRGSKAVVPVVTLFIVHSADVVLLSRYASHSEVGIYRVVSRFAAVPSYFASAFLMAWAPLERGVMFQSTYRHVGEERVRGAILTYYLLAGITLVMLLDLTAPGLMLLVGPQYRSAALVIPLAGAGFVCYGLFIVLVRSVVIERRMLFYGLGGVMACVLDIGISNFTIPRLGLYGVPAGMIAGLLLTCAAGSRLCSAWRRSRSASRRAPWPGSRAPSRSPWRSSRWACACGQPSGRWCWSGRSPPTLPRSSSSASSSAPTGSCWGAWRARRCTSGGSALRTPRRAWPSWNPGRATCWRRSSVTAGRLASWPNTWGAPSASCAANTSRPCAR